MSTLVNGDMTHYVKLQTSQKAVLLYVFIAACTVSLVLVCTVPLHRSPFYGTLEIVVTVFLLLLPTATSLNVLMSSITFCDFCSFKCVILPLTGL